MESSEIFNPRPRIERVRLANGQTVFVIDDALADPEWVLTYASTQREAFRSVDFNAYPGIYLLAPNDVESGLSDFFRQHIRPLFDARRTLSVHCRYSMVSTPPRMLRPYQWICHRDSMNIPSRQSIQASVLYLFKDQSLGGTGFYEPAHSEREIAPLFHDSTTLSPDAFAQKYAMDPGYMLDSNRYFTKVGNIPAKWNRLIFYDGAILHSGDILSPDKLSDDPERGRLTLNGFFTCSRNAV